MRDEAKLTYAQAISEYGTEQGDAGQKIESLDLGRR